MSEERATYGVLTGWTVRPELTPRESDVLRLVAAGLERKEIAQRLCLSVSTVKIHLERLRKKARAHTMAQVISVAYQRGWLSVEPES